MYNDSTNEVPKPKEPIHPEMDAGIFLLNKPNSKNSAKGIAGINIT